MTSPITNPAPIRAGYLHAVFHLAAATAFVSVFAVFVYPLACQAVTSDIAAISTHVATRFFAAPTPQDAALTARAQTLCATHDQRLWQAPWVDLLSPTIAHVTCATRAHELVDYRMEAPK